jgi:CheY-like chemotaxis protein
VIQRNAEAQAKLIEDLLDVSRIMTGKLRIESQPVSFAAITESVVSSLRPAIDAKQLNLETSIDPTAGPIMGDPARLQQIVTNLLSNAIKFTPGGGSISLCVQRLDSRVQLKVTDTGVGIAAENLPHIFERFRQVDSSNVRAHGGLGLGLAIVDYLVRQQGGIVTVESEGIGKGAAFTVEFPLTTAQVIHGDLSSVAMFTNSSNAMVASGDELGDQKLRNYRILLVEDDVDTRELLRTLLRRHGAEVISVGSTSSALSEIARRKPHVIISDIGMVGENGYDFMRRVRALSREQGGHIPAIALTAYAGVGDRRRALAAGFQTHLSKPVEPEDLVAVIRSLTFHHDDGAEETKC